MQERFDAMEWLQLFDTTGRYLYWNPTRGKYSHDAPEGADVEWGACLAEDGDLYYFRLDGTGEPVWDLPADFLRSEGQDGEHEQQPEEPPEPSRLVYIDGLTHPDLQRINGVCGHVVSSVDGWAVVQLPYELGGTMVGVPEKCTSTLPAGTLVDCASSRGDRFQPALIMSCDEKAELYTVHFQDGTEKSVDAQFLSARSRMLDVRLPVWPDAPATGGEDFSFLDYQGLMHKFCMNLPACFDQSKAWPLLIYMHGAAGGTFFAFGKKTNKTEGMQYALRTFVVVSPRCEWQWTESPGAWVNELVKELQRCFWIDHKRTYITGCSMGGMGTWEVAAGNPELYAAMAPVAAYHKKDLRHLIVKQLENMPILCVHAQCDSICPLQEEAPIWDELKQGGCNVEVKIIPDADHNTVHRDAYCHDTSTFLWFLRHTKREPRAIKLEPED